MIKGQVFIEVKEPDNKGILQTVKTIKEDNIICIRALEQLINFSTTRVFNNSSNFRIVLSSTNITPTFNIRTLTSSIFASGDSSPFINSFVFTKRNVLDTVNPSDIVYKQRFVAPTVNRTINSIALSDSIGLVNNATATANIYTYLRLTIPIVQTNTQTLDISYRLFIDWTNSIVNNLNVNIAELYENYLFGGTYISTNSFLDASKINSAYYNNQVGINFLESSAFPGGSNFNSALSTNAVINTTSLSLSNTANRNISNAPFSNDTNWIGRFTSNLSTTGLFANFSTGLPYSKVQEFNKTTNLSDVTSHSLTSALATYDVNNLANSSWRPNITDGPQLDFPSMYILKVTQSGGLGVGRYKVYKSGWGGWYRGLWANAIADPFLSTDFSYHENKIDFVEDNYSAYNTRWLYTWNSTLGNETVVSFKRNYGVGIYTITDRNLILNNLWKNNINGLGTYINGIAVAPAINRIYVAMNTGLYEINVTTNAISTLSSDKCLAVCVGFNNQVFAAFNTTGTLGRLSSSIGTNWQTPLNMGTVNPAINWANIWRLYIDNKNTDYQLMIIEGAMPQGVVVLDTINTTTTKFIRRWWSNTIGVQLSTSIVYNPGTVPTVFSDLILFPSHNAVIGDRGIWVYYNDLYKSWAVSSTDTLNISKDLETDLINSNFFINSYVGYFHNRGNISKGNSSGNNIQQGVLQRRFLNKGRIAVGLFAQAPLTQFFSSGNSCGDWIKPRLSSDGNIFSVVFTICNHSYNGVYQENNSYKINTAAYSISTTVIKTGTYPWNLTAPVTETVIRQGIFVKVDIDLTSTPAANMIDYTDIGTSTVYALTSPQNSYIANVKVTHDKKIMLFDPQTNLVGNAIKMYSPIHVPNNDLNDILCQTWTWNNTTSQWEDDPLNNGQGKLLHSTNDNLVDGLSIQWSDLQPGNSKDLVAGQYYVFTKTSAPGQVAIEQQTPPLTFVNSIQLRQYAQGNTIISIPNTTASFFVKEAPGGSATNINWYGTNSSAAANSNHISNVTINGVAGILSYGSSTTPSLGTVIINDNGRIRVNSGDVNKTLVLNYSYAFKYDSTEPALP